jgi:hypothetical protein
MACPKIRCSGDASKTRDKPALHAKFTGHGLGAKQMKCGAPDGNRPGTGHIFWGYGGLMAAKNG